MLTNKFLSLLIFKLFQGPFVKNYKKTDIALARFTKTPFWENHIAQTGFLVFGPIEANVRKCVFPKYASLPYAYLAKYA